MKSVAIVYFSGTGNTKFLAEAAAGAFEEKNVKVTLVAMEEFTQGKRKIDELASCDCLGIMHPIYAFNAPMIVDRFVTMLPKGTGTNVFLFRVGAGKMFLNDAADFYVKNALLSKGYAVTYERFFVMPSNYMMPYPKPLVKQLFAVGAARAKKAAGEIMAGVKADRHYSLWDAAIPLMFAMQRFGSKYFGLKLNADEKCTSCGWCAKACPCGNIVMKDTKPLFGEKCIMCMRCIHGCHVSAIKVGKQQKKFTYRPLEVLKDGAVKDTFVTKDTKGYFHWAIWNYLSEE